MNKRLALTLYLALWAALSAGVIFCLTRAGYPLWAAVVSAFLLFVFVNGSLAYRAHTRRLKLEGKKAPPYLQYIFFPSGVPKFKAEAPRSTHVLVGLAAALAGVFFVFCGVALAFDGKWSRIEHPFVVATICFVLAGIGAAFLYVAWRLFAFRSSLGRAQ